MFFDRWDSPFIMCFLKNVKSNILFLLKYTTWNEYCFKNYFETSNKKKVAFLLKENSAL